MGGSVLKHYTFLKTTDPSPPGHNKRSIPKIYIFTRCLCQKPSLARTSLVRVFTKTTREYNPVRRTFYDVNYIYCLYFSPEAVVKLTRRARGHFVTLFEVIMYLIECYLGHIVTKARRVYYPLPKDNITKTSLLHGYPCIQRLYLCFEVS